MNGLRGLVAQSMRASRGSITAAVYTFPAGSSTFTAPANGFYRFVLWGAGGGGSISTDGLGGGGSGAFISAIRYLAKGQVAATVVAPPVFRNGNGTATTVTLPNGEVLSAGGGQAAAGSGGVASAGQLDTAINGTGGVAEGVNGVSGAGTNPGAGGAGNGNAGGAGAPGSGTFKGGGGAGGGGGVPAGIGGGGASQSSFGVNIMGGTGSLTVSRVRIPR